MWLHLFCYLKHVTSRGWNKRWVRSRKAALLNYSPVIQKKNQPPLTFPSFTFFFFYFNSWLTGVSFSFDLSSFLSYNAKYSIINSFLSCYMFCWLAAVADSGCFRGRGGKNKKSTSCIREVMVHFYRSEGSLPHFVHWRGIQDGNLSPGG